MSDRYWVMPFNAVTHGPDLLGSGLWCIVDEKEGGIIAYATSDDMAQKILRALRAAA